MGNHPKRRKKTNAEISEMNKARQRQQEYQEIKQQQQQQQQLPNWDDLPGLHATCRGMLGTIGPVSQLFVNKELLEAMGDNVIKLRDLAATLDRDVKEYITVLEQIAQQHQGKSGVIQDDTGNELMQMLQIGEQYHQWTVSFESVVIPTVADIFSLANTFLPEDKKIQNPGAPR